jgi:DNA polymerase-3 subunit gamma/tau
MFAEMVGQEHVLKAIINALDNDRLHHAFLFTGTRGVGKTTIARILAKSLNCERGVSSTPCGECPACVEIDAGRFVDLIEVDAASRTKVEDTREILDNVQYAPTRGRYKVYLIDEVHMLSKNSFNALLKTLEEPPPHIKFLLATTDPQKLPVTILSRCLQFNLKRLPQQLIVGHLKHILEAEDVAFEDTAVQQLAHAADGSLRDALSLMDQGIAFGQGRLGAEDMRVMLGTIDRASVYPLLEALVAGDVVELLAGVERIAEQAPDYNALLEDLISLLHRLALIQMVPEAGGDEWDSEADRAVLEQLAPRMTAEDIQLYYQIALIGRRDLPLAPEPRAGLEMILLRMLAFRPQGATRAKAPQAVPAAGQRDGGDSARPAPATARSEGAAEAAMPDAGASARESSTATDAGDDWAAIVEALALTGMVKQLAVHCVLERRDERAIHLRLDEAHAHLGRDTMKQRLEQCLQEHFSSALGLVLHVGQPPVETPAARQQRLQEQRLEAAEEAIRNDGAVRALQETFDARIVPETIQPVGS